MKEFLFEHHSESNVGLVRKANEDSYGHEPNSPYGEVFTVCDGMGGHVGGARASSTAVECILEYMSGHRNESVTEAIKNAILFANMQIFAIAQQDESLHGMGTTCTVAVVGRDGKIYIGHVGDSRIYLQTSGKLHRITKDHSFVQMLVDSGAIRDDEAEKHPKKNQILQALGTSEVVKPEVPEQPILLKEGDQLLLCSDGLNGMTKDDFMESVLNQFSGSEAVNKLLKLALDGGGKDNVTATLIRVKASPYPQTVFRSLNPKPLAGAGAASGSGQDTKPLKKPGIPRAAILTVAIVLALGVGWGYDHFKNKSQDKVVLVGNGGNSGSGGNGGQAGGGGNGGQAGGGGAGNQGGGTSNQGGGSGGQAGGGVAGNQGGSLPKEIKQKNVKTECCYIVNEPNFTANDVAEDVRINPDSLLSLNPGVLKKEKMSIPLPIGTKLFHKPQNRTNKNTMHTVKPGETLTSIAADYKVEQDEIVKANPKIFIRGNKEVILKPKKDKIIIPAERKNPSGNTPSDTTKQR